MTESATAFLTKRQPGKGIYIIYNLSTTFLIRAPLAALYYSVFNRPRKNWSLKTSVFAVIFFHLSK